MTSMTDERRVVFAGVDTHRDTVHVAVVDELGRHLGEQQFPTTSRGYAAVVRFINAYGDVRAVGVEGTASYGAGLACALREAAFTVVEVDQADRAQRARRGKSDPLDAQAAARAVASGRASAVPKTRDGNVEAIRVLHVVRAGAVKARTQTINQLKALLVTAPAPLREAITTAAPDTAQLVSTCARLRAGAELGDPGTATKTALRVLARRYQQLTKEITTLGGQIAALVHASAPHLVAIYGVGPDTAAQLLITAGDNPDRLSSEAAFARLCGVAPIPASSGQTQRHRLHRGGDRQANRALYMIALTRLANDERTKAYRDRRRQQGRTNKEIIRCLKRYIAREIHHALTA